MLSLFSAWSCEKKMIRTISFAYYSRVIISDRLIAKCARFFTAPVDQDCVRQVLGLLDMYLDITDQKIIVLKNPKLIEGFWGFLAVETNATPAYLHMLVSKLRKIAHLIGLDVSEYHSLCGKKNTNKAKAYYESTIKNAERLIFYQGWWLIFLDEKPIFVQLAAIYTQFGKAVSDEFFRRVRDYATRYLYTSAVRINRLVSLLFALLVNVFKDGQELDLLQDPTEMHAFFVHAYQLESQRRRNKQQDMNAFSREWSAMMHVVEEVFIANELLPEKLYDFAFEEDVQIDKDNPFTPGESKKLVSLITSLPAHISNEAAAKKLYDRINGDVNDLISACEEARYETLEAFKRRQVAAIQCDTKEVFSAASAEQQKYMLLCKKWREHPYPTMNDHKFREYYGVTKGEASVKLDLLSSVTLLPFIYLIVNEVPAITRSWFLKHLYTDKHKQVFGVSEEQNHAIGKKPRRGPFESEQVVRFTPKAMKLLSEIYEITAEARTWLETQGDKAARYTLLSSATGVTRPTKLGKLSGMSAQKNSTSLLASKILQRFGQHGTTILKRLSMNSMRFTSAVVVYFKTSSVYAMSEALGHKHYDSKLLNRYLPKAIRRYYLGKWVRNFQNGIIFEVFKDSHLLLVAMGVKSIAEIEEFIKNHKLKPLPPQMNLKNWLPAGERNSKKNLTKGIILVGLGISTLMVSMDYLAKQYQASNVVLPRFLESWRLNAEYTRHAVEISKSGELDLVDDEVISILSKVEVSEPLVKMLHDALKLDGAGLHDG